MRYHPSFKAAWPLLCARANSLRTFAFSGTSQHTTASRRNSFLPTSRNFVSFANVSRFRVKRTPGHCFFSAIGETKDVKQPIDPSRPIDDDAPKKPKKNPWFKTSFFAVILRPLRRFDYRYPKAATILTVVFVLVMAFQATLWDLLDLYRRGYREWRDDVPRMWEERLNVWRYGPMPLPFSDTPWRIQSDEEAKMQRDRFELMKLTRRNTIDERFEEKREEIAAAFGLPPPPPSPQTGP